MAEIFNEYFSNIASEIGFQDQHSTAEEAISAHNNHPSVIKIRDTYGDNAHSFNFEIVDHNCIAKKLQMINIRKATGYDNIPAKLLRLAHNELTYSITNLVNNSMAMSTFPGQLKGAELSPLYKKEDNLNVTPWNRGVNIAPRIGMFNPVSRDSPPGGCYGDRKMFLLYDFITGRYECLLKFG